MGEMKRETGLAKQVMIRVSKDMHMKLEREAEAAAKPLSEYCRGVLEQRIVKLGQTDLDKRLSCALDLSHSAHSSDLGLTLKALAAANARGAQIQFDRHPDGTPFAQGFHKGMRHILEPDPSELLPAQICELILRILGERVWKLYAIAREWSILSSTTLHLTYSAPEKLEAQDKVRCFHMVPRRGDPGEGFQPDVPAMVTLRVAFVEGDFEYLLGACGTCGIPWWSSRVRGAGKSKAT